MAIDSDSHGTAKRLAGEVALVIGGANGIGAATALRLAADGARVVVADIDTSASERLVEHARADALTTIECDATSAEQLVAAAHEAETRYGPVTQVVHSPFVDVQGRADELTADQWSHVLNVNLTSAFLAVKSVMPGMVKRARGSLTFVSSIKASVGYPRSFAYTAAKAGLVGLTRQLATDYGPFGIRANSVSPSYTPNERNAATVERSQADRIRFSTPLRHLATAEDTAAVIAFLASRDAGYITGQDIRVDGGLSVQSVPQAMVGMQTAHQR